MDFAGEICYNNLKQMLITIFPNRNLIDWNDYMKRFLPILLCILMILSALPVAASAAEEDSAETGAQTEVAETGWNLLTEAQFQAKMAEVQQEYPDGGVFSGVYYEDGYVKAWTCWAYACQMLYEFFGAQYYNDGLYENADYDNSNLEDRLCAGDWVRIDMWGGNGEYGTHSIFLTKITSEGVYYTDGNGDGANGIRWNAFYSWKQMKSLYVFRVHLPGNTLKGGDVVHTVAYDANGGSGSIASETYKPNADFTVQSCGCTKEGSQFAGYTLSRSDGKWLTTDAGWQTKSNIFDKGYTYAVYQPGAKLTLNSTLLGNVSAAMTFTFTAQWLPNQSTVEFFSNYSGYNYLLGSSFADGYASYIKSRNKDVYTVTNDGERYNNQPSLKIVGKTAGSSGKDLSMNTSTNAGYGDGYSVAGAQGDSKSMTLRLNIKSETDGAKFLVRWGYQSTSAYTSVTLSRGWKTYTLSVPKNNYFGSSLHPYFDKAGTYLINSVTLSDDSSTTAIAPESGYRAADSVKVTRGGAIGTLPTPVREGYTFLGWYTAAEGGKKVDEKTVINESSLRLYAHWSKDASLEPTKTFEINGHYYELYDNAMTWADAKRFCEEQGGHLLTIDGYYENNQVFQKISDRTGYCWLGLSYSTSAKTWEWVTGEAYFFNYWYNSNYGATDDGRHYAIMYPMNLNGTAYAAKWGKLADTDSYRNYEGYQNSFFICEYEYNGFIGDADGNGEVNQLDATIIQRAHSDIPTGLSEETLLYGDIDGNAEVDLTDATFIQRYVAEMEIPYAVGKRKG